MASTSTETTTSARREAVWDVAQAPKNYFSLVLTQGGGTVFAFASVWLITKALGSAGYGQVVAVIAASQAAQVLVNWTSQAVARFGTEEFVETEKIARIFWLRLLVLVPNLLLVVLAAYWFLPWLAVWLKLSPAVLWLVVLHFTTAVLWLHVQLSLQGAKLPRVHGGLMMLERVASFAGLVVLWSNGRLQPATALLSYALAALLMTVCGLVYLRPLIWARVRADWAFVRQTLAYSLPLFPFSLVGYFSGNYLDALFVARFLATQELGLYSVATQINGIALQLPTLANALLLPLFVTLQKEGRYDKMAGYFLHVLPVLSLLWGVFCTALAFAGYFVVPLVFGAEFAAARLPLWVLLAASAIALPAMVGYAVLANARSATYIAMFAALFSAGVNVGANLLLIPKYGLAGCAWATLLAYAVSVGIFAGLSHRAAKVSLSWTLWALVPALCGAAIFSYGQNPGPSLAVCAGLSGVLAYIFRASLRITYAFFQARFK